MLSKDEIKEYRMRSGLTYRDVASYCDVSYQLIEMVENGKKDLTDFNYKEIIRGINGAKQAKKNGTFQLADKTDNTNNAAANSEKVTIETKKADVPKNKNFVKQDKAGVSGK